MKFIRKYKFFMIIVLALLILVMGFLFMKNTKETYVAEAGKITYTYNFSTYWNNGSGERQTGVYKSLKGNNVYDGLIGYIEISTSGSGGSWEGPTRTDTLTGKASRKFKSTNYVPFYVKDFKASVDSIYVDYIDGFTSNVESSGYTGLSGSYGCFVDESDSDYITYVFSPKTYTINFYSVNNNGLNTVFDKTATIFYEDYTITNKVPTRTGYTFNGWYDKKSGGTKIKSDTCFNDTGKTSIYAQWKANSYTIFFDRNSGSEGNSNITATYDSVCPDIQIPVKKGYSFKGYYDSKTGGTQYYDEKGNGIETYKIDGDKTLYARWEVNEYKVSINTNYGVISNLNGWTNNNGIYKQIAYDSSYGTLPSLTREGYTFDRYTNSLGGATITSSTIMQTDSNHTLNAKWIENTYTIRFNANGGSGTMNSMTGLKYSQNYTLLSNSFKRNNYLFKGWSTDPNSNVQYLDCENVNKLTSTNNKDVTLYAVWESTWATKAIKPSGAGTQNNPYKIATATNLAWLASQTQKESLGGYFLQTANIDLAGQTWLPIGNLSYNFTGVYDGGNYCIMNLTSSTTVSASGHYLSSNVALFGKVYLGEIRNVNILSGEICGFNNIAGVVSQLYYGKVSGCQSNATIKGLSSGGGVVAKSLYSDIENCYSKADIIVDLHAGGIVSELYVSNLNSSGFEGTITGEYIYLIASIQYGIVNDCFANSSSTKDFCVGEGTIKNSVYIFGSEKYCFSGDYSNWIISVNNIPVPSGLLWIANGGEKLSGLDQLLKLGFILV